MTFKKGNKIGVRFPEQKINRKGRPLKIYTQLKKMGYTKDDIRSCFGELAFYKTNDLRELIEDDTKPHIVKMVARQLVAAFEEADWSKVRDIMEQVLGKAHQTKEMHVETTLKDKTQVFINLTDEEEAEIIEEEE